MAYRITGLDPAHFRHLYGLSDEALAAQGAKRYAADANPGFPDRIEVRDLEIGERAILVNYVHQPTETPYRASHAIFVREGAETPLDVSDTIPEGMRRRVLSLRAFDDAGDMRAAELTPGEAAEAMIAKLFADPAVTYIQAHYATRGCYAARIERA